MMDMRSIIIYIYKHRSIMLVNEPIRFPSSPDTQWSWMQYLSYHAYEWLPHWPKYNPDPLFMHNPGHNHKVIAWHSRYQSVFAHTLGYRMQRAIAQKDVQEVTTIVRDRDYHPDQQIEKRYGWSAIHMLAQMNGYAIAQLLLLHGANINLQDRHGNTPLMMAVERGNHEMIHTLLKNGADIFIRNKYGYTALDKAEQDPNITKFIKSFIGTKRRFPKFKIQMEFQKKLRKPFWEQVKGVKLYSSKPKQMSFYDFVYSFTEHRTVRQILQMEKRKEQEQKEQQNLKKNLKIK